jgi:hypothetical protein
MKFIQSQDHISAETHIDIADVLQEQNRFLEAEKYLDEAFKVDPENPGISRRKKRLLKLKNSITASDE